MAYKDLREWLEAVEKIGELKTVRNAHWDLELGAITEIVQRKRGNPAVVFDDISGYPSGYQVLINSLGSANRYALTTGLPLGLNEKELTLHWREKSKNLRMIPPRYVSDGPVMENVQRGDDIDLFKFPTPRWHEMDGGRYIGTGSVDITRDRDEGWVNVGTYRVMIKDRNHVFFYISPGKHGAVQRQKYFESNEPMPVAMSFGHDPLIFFAGSLEVPYGISEFDYCGAIKGEPIDVIKGEITGLPIPAFGEIVIEGICTPGDVGKEGPFGEWTGYYASASRLEPVVEVKAVYHRNNPIILGLPPVKPPGENTYYRGFSRSAAIYEELEKAGIPDVRGVWCHECGGTRLMTAVGIKQRYPGHAKQTGLIAAACHAGAYLGRYVIVVDEDIDVTDLNDVMWAVCTRTDPEKSIDIVRRLWSGPLDPILPAGEKTSSSRAIIDACRPYEWKDQFPAVAECSPELLESTRKKWGEYMGW